MTMLVPSHLAGRLFASASNISCASLPTPLPLRASASFKRATAASARAERAAVFRGASGGKAFVNGAVPLVDGGADMRVKFWILDMGRIRKLEGVIEMATRLVRGQVVNSVPSMTGLLGTVVVMRILSMLDVTQKTNQKPSRMFMWDVATGLTVRQWLR